MLTSDAIRHYKNRAAIARALEISRTAVSRWGPIVPEGSAYKLFALSEGAIPVRPEDYKKNEPINREAIADHRSV
jgi:hypothetical protein